MDDVMKDLGRRAIAAGFVWAPGCKSLGPWSCRVLLVKPTHNLAWLESAFDWPFAESAVNPTDAPDLSDPATLGCLLAQVRERWEDRGLSVCGIYEAGVWVWMFNEGKPHGASFYRARSVRQPSEAAALVAALEAAPKVTR